jgi:nicotinamidase-related amidase
LERLITELDLSTFIVCGAGVGHGIVEAVIGLRNRGHRVLVAKDGVLAVGQPRYTFPMERMEAKGALLLPAKEIISPADKVVPAVKHGRSTRWAGSGAA